MKSYINKLIICIILFAGVSCEDYLAEEPKSFASTENLFNNETAINQVLNGIYNVGAQIFWRERYLVRYNLSGDDIVSENDNDINRRAFNDYTVISTNNYIRQAWKGHTNGIARTNLFLENLEEFEDGLFKDRMRAEAKFLRAMFYFLQVRTFGNVPLLTEFENADLFPSQAEIPQVYDQIIADFKDAAENLPRWDEITGEQGRPTSTAAKAFLGKVYLTMATTPETQDNKYFQLAAEQFKELIDNHGLKLLANYMEVFQPQNEGGSEDIFSWQFLKDLPSPRQGYIHAYFSPNPGVYGQRGFARFIITPFLYDKLEDADARKLAMVKGEYESIKFNEAGNPVDTSLLQTPNNWALTTKFLDPDAGRFSHNNTNTNLPLMRYAEVLLMYSEAVNESVGPNAEAYMGIDMVRERAGASQIPRGLSQGQLREYIRDERLLELHGEGKRWYDLVRWGILEDRINEVKPEAAVEWPKHRFFPIPQEELDVNRNLVQNPGY